MTPFQAVTFIHFDMHAVSVLLRCISSTIQRILSNTIFIGTNIIACIDRRGNFSCPSSQKVISCRRPAGCMGASVLFHLYISSTYRILCSPSYPDHFWLKSSWNSHELRKNNLNLVTLKRCSFFLTIHTKHLKLEAQCLMPFLTSRHEMLEATLKKIEYEVHVMDTYGPNTVWIGQLSRFTARLW